MRERELKLEQRIVAAAQIVSLPMRERELKLAHSKIVARFGAVAPHAGARIETIAPARCQYPPHVAPHAGARIETLHCFCL